MLCICKIQLYPSESPLAIGGTWKMAHEQKDWDHKGQRSSPELVTKGQGQRKLRARGREKSVEYAAPEGEVTW